MSCSEGRKKKWVDDLMPEIVWTPTYLGILLTFIWVFESGKTLLAIPILIFCSLILECVYRFFFGEKRHSFSFLVVTFVIQCIAWGLIIRFGIFGMWNPSH